MGRNSFYLAVLLVSNLFIGAFAHADDAESECISRAQKFEEKLACLQDVEFVETIYELDPSVRAFDIQFTQPIDHTNPSLGTFKQRLVLLHRDENEPMVLQTSGYSIFGIREARITYLYQTNQLQVEHRFFSTSRPNPLDWSKLDIKQSADDFHRITVAFKKIYGKRWVNTGASKGGMTSVYHRRFYPDDLDGTVADVAPLSFTKRDQRYNEFIAHVGGDRYKACREAFKNMQVTLLKNRDKFLPLVQGNYSHLGSKEVAYEHWVIESIFFFWQYGNPEDVRLGCDSVVAAKSPKAIFQYVNLISPITDYSDESLERFIPYYYQASTQLGGPDNLTSHLETLRHFTFEWDQYVPKGITYSYSNTSMRDVDQWVRSEADQILFVYGEFDPWTAGEFPVSETGRTVYKLYVPGGNHGANFTLLPPAERQLAQALISQWLNKKPVKSIGGFSQRTFLEDIDLENGRTPRL